MFYFMELQYGKDWNESICYMKIYRHLIGCVVLQVVLVNRGILPASRTVYLRSLRCPYFHSGGC